ncbi:FUSC family protein [Pseudokineococcus basanitobsidens]|uniref:FUSC family protein n=1 Tax=Pseudokineococcus basanitobsidens TaxID=1926649 RepID=A0ABU8RI33_9ACTN
MAVPRPRAVAHAWPLGWQVRVGARGRRSARDRVARLRRRGPNILQCALAGTLAWALARYALGHEQPFFAPVAAVVALGQAYEGRLRRTAEVVVGVAVGVGVGELLVSQLGSGVWQLALVVALSMSLAVLLDAGQLLVTQAGVQAAIVTALAAPVTTGVDRWVDALVGGSVALAVAALLPTAPLQRPRRLAASATAELAELLAEASLAARDADGRRARAALERARTDQGAYEALGPAADEALAGLRLSPFRHRHRPGLVRVRDLAVPLDRGVRNVRVLLRRLSVAAQSGEALPAELGGLLDDLAVLTTQLSEAVLEARRDDDVLLDLAEVGRRAGALADGPLGLSAAVCVGQVRSTVVDLLQVGGWSDAQSLAAVPPVR